MIVYMKIKHRPRKNATDLFELIYGSLMQGIVACNKDKEQLQNPYREGGERSKEPYREWREEAWDLGWRSYYKEMKKTKEEKAE